MTAKVILNALEKRHQGDVFIPECKTGPTWFNDGLRIMDAWVLKRSWINLTTVCYEIKISRGDFLRDNKWHEYLPFCHEFYFVCPWGMIQPDEIQSPAGLCYITKNGSRIYRKKDCEKRNIEVDAVLLLHIIMSRMYTGRPNDIAYYERENRFLEHRVQELKKELRDVSH